MKKLIGILLGLILTAVTAHAQTALQVALTWNAPGCAATVTTDSNGAELTGPCNSQVYRAAITSGAQCPAFSPTAYTEIASAQPENSSTAAYVDTTVATGASYCYAVTDTFALGGAASGLSNIFPITVILQGTPGTPSGLSGTVK